MRFKKSFKLRYLIVFIFIPLVFGKSSPEVQADGLKSPNAALVTYTSSPNLAIPDSPDIDCNDRRGADAIDTITIAESGTITDVDLDLGITHGYSGDLQVRLTSPVGTIRNMIVSMDGSTTIGRGTGVSCGCDSPNIYTMLDDESPNGLIEFACADTLLSSYQPAVPLSAFDGQNLNGTWTLTVRDWTESYTGTVDSWSLIITYDPVGGTSTPTDTVTATYTSTQSDTPTYTSTPSDTPTDTFTPSDTATDTPTVATDTPTDSATDTDTPTPSDTATNIPTATDTPTDTATDTATHTFTPSDTATNTFTPSDTASDTPTDTATNTATNTFTPSDTATDIPTATDTPTNTWTPSNTPTFTSSNTLPFTPTDTATNPPTNTATFTATFTPSITFTPSRTFTSSPTACMSSIAPPTLIAPTHRAHLTDTTPSFDWSNVPNAQSYRLMVYLEDRSFVFKKRVFVSNYTLVEPLVRTQYLWRTRTQDATCSLWSSWSKRNTLFID
jgi:subtilisin-like proprotein convertase family protein